MKMFRLLTSMIVLIAIGVAGCSVGSPDFTPRLVGIKISPVGPTTIPLGDKLQFTAIGTYTTPPGSATNTVDGPVDVVAWSVDNTQVATIDSSGLVASAAQGSIIVTVAKDSFSAQSNLTVGPPVLRQLVVSPATATIALGASQTYTVDGVYSDGAKRLDLAVYPVTWASDMTMVATVSPTTSTPTTGAKTTASSGGPGQTTGQAGISASTTSEGKTVKGTSQLTVTNAVLQSVKQVTPASDVVTVGVSKPFQLIGTYSDGSTAPIPNSMIDWTVSDTAIASLTADPNDNQVLAKGVKIGGPVDITGTLKSTVNPAITQRTAPPAKLSVFAAACTTPLLGPAAKATPSVDMTCVGCSVNNPDNVTDADPTNFAVLNSSVGLLSGGVNLTVTSGAATPFAAGKTTGFIIGQPVGQTTPPGAMSQLTVATLLGTTVQESSTSPKSSELGQIGSSSVSLLSIQTTKPFDGIRVSFSSPVGALSSSTQVFAACGTATLPPS